jgi:phenylpropionate dioxygenase-like ring-hydroxylating dioxygenase large terminal subunit
MLDTIDSRGLRGDGTRSISAWIPELVDVERREVKLAVHADPEVYRQELKSIFTKTWNFVAHASEIPNPRDFVTRFIGADPVIVCRQADGSVRVMLNSCTHKGALLCRQDTGRTNRFMCPYHGFAFRPDGSLASVPLEKECYGPNFDRADYSLIAARVEEVTGLLFATWDNNGPSLREYLGNYTKLLEATFARTSAGMEVVGPPQRWIVASNWKLGPEQFAGDGYHALTSHVSVGTRETQLGSLNGIDISINGHGARCIGPDPLKITGSHMRGEERHDNSHSALRALPPTGLTPVLVEEFLATASQEQIALVAACPPTVGTIFPNFMWLCVQIPGPNSNVLFGMHDIRIMRPLSHDRTEMWSWALVERDIPQELKDEALNARTFYFSPAGAIERDDVEMWTRIQRAAAGPIGQNASVHYRALSAPDDDELFPGLKTWRGWSLENTAWEYMLRWRALMANEA